MMDSLEEWARKIQAGERRAIARAISAVENGDASSVPLLKRLFLAARRTRVIGVTGPPGAGKSTLVEKLAVAYRREELRVGILAVDPTSPLSGGAILGDRIRMQSLHSDEGIYIRSMATRGNMGGLAIATADAVIILEGAGCQVVLIETVGVGQDETEIVSLADVTLLLLVPGMGDDVQAFKAGVMEIADIFVVNKADRGGAEKTEHEIRTLLNMAPAQTDDEGWRAPIVKTTASTGEGVDDVHHAIEDFRSHAERTSLGIERDRRQLRQRILHMALRRLLGGSRVGASDETLLAARVDQVRHREVDPYSVVEELIRNLSIKRLSH